MIRIIITAFLLSTALAYGSGILISAQAAPVKVAAKRQEFRDNFIRYEVIIDYLNIAPGMTILDIGAGTGYASFLFAEKLKGSGEVYATDVREHFTEYMAAEAKRRKINNLFPVLVSKNGLDPFYGEHKYDLVFMSFVYHRIEDPVEYFTKLREFLKPGSRLVLVLYNQAPLLSPYDFNDLDGLVKAFSDDEHVRYKPFIQNLSSSTRMLLTTTKDRETIAQALVEDMNQMLMNPRFYTNLPELYHQSKELDGSMNLRMSNLTAYARELANWLFMTLNEEGILKKPIEQIDAREMRSVIKLNRLLFGQQIGRYLVNNGMGAYMPGGDASRHTGKYEAIRELNLAGYRLVGEIGNNSYFETIIMTADQGDLKAPGSKD